MLRRAAIVASTLLMAGAPALAQPPQGRQVEVARGEALVAQNCSMCHATGTSGDSPNPDAPHFRDLGKRYPVEDIAEALGEGMIVGHSPMPELHFSSQDVHAIVAYLQSIQAR